VPAVDVRLVDVVKRFGDVHAVDHIDLEVHDGEFFSLLGPSGCGKTTTLRMIGGFEEPTSGLIELQGEDVTWLPPFKRNVNTVFQNYALFPHLTIFENVAFGLRRRGVKDYRQKTLDMIELVQLAPYVARKPAQLSGGQQQRVALGRALINEPGVLLLDEPLGALDLKLRRQMQIELKRIQTEIGITFVHVTHDQEEAMTMADTIAVMNHGLIEQMGAPGDLYENPVTTFVANFLGQSNLIMTDIIDGAGAEVVVDCQGQKIGVSADRCHAQGRKAWLGIRPEKIFASHVGDAERTDSNVLTGGRITDVSFVGVSTQYLVAMPWDQELMVFEQNTGRRPLFNNGDEVDLSWSSEHAFLLDADQDAHAGMMTPEDRE
jgi:spermidine/putrescine transport system ATP-binding protein